MVFEQCRIVIDVVLLIIEPTFVLFQEEVWNMIEREHWNSLTDAYFATRRSEEWEGRGNEYYKNEEARMTSVSQYDNLFNCGL